MIETLVGLSVRLRALILGATIALLAIGVGQLRGAQVDEYPDFTAPQVEVQAEALGLSAAEVEQLITVPLEQDLLNGVPWLDQITSESLPGLSTIDMTFNRGTDLLKARQMVQEHMTQAHALPQVGTPPVMIQPTAAAGRVLMVSLKTNQLSLVDLSVLARWKIKPRLEGLPGVASVAVWGQRDRQLQVQVDPRALRHYGVSLDQVISSTGNALWVSPLTFVEASTPGTGGFVDTASQRLGIQHVTPITTARTLSQVTIEDTGKRIVRLGQVSHVVVGHQPLIGDAISGDRSPGLMLVIQKFPGADTRTVTDAVEEAIDEMRPGLAGVQIDTTVYRPATYIGDALHSLWVRALIGLALAAVVIGALLLSWRYALLSMLTMSTSVVGAALVLQLRGVTFDLMTLAGVAGAAGVVVAESISNAEAYAAPARSNDPDGERAAVAHARTPLMYASLIALLVPVPVLAFRGVAGSFARSFLVTYVLIVLASFLVATLVAPAIGSLLWRTGRTERPSPVIRAAQRGFDRIGAGFARRGAAIGVALGVLLLAGLPLLPQLHSDHGTLPALQDRELLVSFRSDAATSLPEMARITARATEQLRALPAVSGVGGHAGRAVMGDESVDVDSAVIWVTLAPGADYKAGVHAVRDVVTGYPGIRARVSTYPSERIAAAQTETAAAPLVVRVYGPDLNELDRQCRRVSTLLERVSGVGRPTVAQQGYEPSVAIQVDLRSAERYGLTPGDVRRASATFFAGLPVGSLYEDQKIFDVVVWGVPAARQSPTDVADFVVDTPSGDRVRLGDIAQVSIRPAPTVIRHSNISRYVDVSADVNGRDLDSVLADVRHRLTELPMPAEFHAEVLSGTEPFQAEHLRLALIIVGTAVGVLLLLQLLLASWRVALLVLLAVPLGAAGTVLVAPLVGGVDTLGPEVALLCVLGLTLRGCVLLAKSFQGAGETAEVMARTRHRLVTLLLPPVALAALVAPFAFGGVTAGTELLQPFALSCLAGLVTSMFVNVLLLPALYARMTPWRRRTTPDSGPVLEGS